MVLELGIFRSRRRAHQLRTGDKAALPCTMAYIRSVQIHASSAGIPALNTLNRLTLFQSGPFSITLSDLLAHRNYLDSR